MTDEGLPLRRSHKHAESVLLNKRLNAFRAFFLEMLGEIHLA